jgi:hypothetical protein
MFADDWLVPITNAGPLDLDDRAAMILEEQRHEDEVNGKDEECQPAGQDDDNRTGCSSETTAERKGPGRPKVNHAKTIWQRRRKRLHRRKSSKAMFETSWQFYKGTVKTLAADVVLHQEPKKDIALLIDGLSTARPEAAIDIISQVVDWHTTIGEVHRNFRQFLRGFTDWLGKNDGLDRIDPESSPPANGNTDPDPGGPPPPTRPGGK